MTCHVNGNFPAGSGYTLTLHARPKAGVYAGPWLTDVDNHAAVQPGKDAANEDLAKDSNPNNNEQDGPVQVRNASIGGRVFIDQNNNGDTDAGDNGLANVSVRLTGTDVYGNAIDVTVTTDGNGEFSVTWPQAGMYWLDVASQDDKVTIPQARQRRLGYVATLEVLPQ